MSEKQTIDLTGVPKRNMDTWFEDGTSFDRPIDLTGDLEPPSKKAKSVDDCHKRPCLFEFADMEITRFRIVHTNGTGDNESFCISGMKFQELVGWLEIYQKQFIEDLYSCKSHVSEYPEWFSKWLEDVSKADGEEEEEDYSDDDEERVPPFIVLLLTLTSPPLEEGEKSRRPSSGEGFRFVSLLQLYKDELEQAPTNYSTAGLIKGLKEQEEEIKLDSIPTTIFVNYFEYNSRIKGWTLCTYRFYGSQLLKDTLDWYNHKYIDDEGEMYTLEGQVVEVCKKKQATASIVRDFLYLNCRLFEKKAYQGNVATNFFYFPR
jgi:hypothetical protein